MKPLKLLILSLTLLSITWPAAAGNPLENPIVFVKQTPVSYTFGTISDVFGNFRGFYPPTDQPIGGNLFRLDPDGTLTNLTGQSNAAVRDPEVSYDATKVIFSMKLGAMGRWQVYEVGIDGTGLRKVSRNGAVNDLDPAYLGDGRIVFTTDREGWADGYENLPQAQLAVMRSDGRGVEVLKRNPSGHFNPLPSSDGMIYFTQWDFHDRRDDIEQDNSDFDVNRFLLWKVFADGSGLDHPHFGAHTVYDFDGGYTEIRELPNEPGNFIAVLADEFFTFGAGSIVKLEPRANQNRDRPIFLTDNVFRRGPGNRVGRWRSPFPLADGRVAAAYAPGSVYNDSGSLTPRFELVTMDGDGTHQQRLYHDPGMWSWQPVEVRPRTAPRLADGEMKPEFPYAIINALDVTLRGRNEDVVLNGDFQRGVAPGEATEVRVYREDVRSRNYYDDDFPNHDDPDVRVLGKAPVAPDGSFAVVVPADTPLRWELLDARGRVLVRERFGTELRAGEVRECAGCHSPHDGRRGNETNMALASPTNLSGENVDRNGNGVVDLLEDDPVDPPEDSCRPGDTELCIDGRFRVEVTWTDFNGATGAGRAGALNEDTGYFWFFNDSNVEVVVKVLDGRSVNGYYWVFSGSLSNVQYTMTVTDTETGQSKSYTNPPGRFASFGDVQALDALVSNPRLPPEASTLEGPALRVAALPGRALNEPGPAVTKMGSCVLGPTTLCVGGGRFRVEIDWRDFGGQSGRGQSVRLTDDTGYFWFFNDSNVEVVIKVLDGRAVNGRFWVFYGALSNVEYTITVRDTVTGASTSYFNPAGQFASVGDTDAL